MHDGVQTHDDIPAIPEGVALPDSSGSLIPNVEPPEPVDYSDVPADTAATEGRES